MEPQNKVTLSAITMIWNEADIIEYTISHLIGEGVERFYVRIHSCTDNTEGILRDLASQYPNMLMIDKWMHSDFDQQRHVNELFLQAVADGTDWVIPFDADELWVCRQGTLRDYLSTKPHEAFPVHLYDHMRSTHDIASKNPIRSMVLRRIDPAPLPKMIIPGRHGYHIDKGNHRVFGSPVNSSIDVNIEVRHFSWRQDHVDFGLRYIEHANRLDAAGVPHCYGTHARVYRDTFLNDPVGFAKGHYLYRFRLLDSDMKDMITGEKSNMIYDPAPYKGSR